MSELPREVYTDIFEHSFDEKGRIAVPAEWRSEAHEKRLHIVPSQEGCLKVYPASFLTEQKNRLAGVSINDPRRKKLETLARMIQAVECDKQGRVMIKQRLRGGAGLNRTAVLVGSLDHFEIWDREKWQQRDKTAESFEEVISKIEES